MLMSLRRFGSLRINMLRKFVSATTQFYFHFRTRFHCPCPRAEMPPAKAKARPPVTSFRPEQVEEEDDDLPPLEPEEETDRLHPSPPTGIPGSDSSDELAPIPDDFTGFPPKKEDMQEDTQEKGEEEKPLEDDQPVEEDIFVKDDEEPLAAFEGFTVSGQKAPRPRSVHADKVVQFEIGTEINTHWMKHITQYPRSERAKGIRKTPEERTNRKITRAEVPILAQTFEKNHSAGAINTKALAIAIRIALDRKMNDPEYQMLTENRTFTHWSKMLAAYLRHEKITHSADGSISIEELAVYDPFIRQLCHSYFDHTDTQGLFGKYTADHILIPNSFRRYGQLIPFYMPLALVLVYNDKGRFEMAVVRSAEYSVSTLPNFHEYESFPSWRDDTNQIISWPDYTELRKQFAERVMYSLEDIVMIHLRAVSGQSANPDLRTGVKLTREYIKEHPNYAFLVHATVQQAMPSIEKNNLRPMGRREGDTRPTHFVPYNILATDPEQLRFQTDVIIVYSGYSLCNCNDVTVTSNGYVNLHDKEGIPLSTALFAYDLYNQRFWFSNFRQKYYAPIPGIYEYMVTPKSHAKSGTEHYADLYQYMRIYCEFKWMTMEDHSKGRHVGHFESYRQHIADALKNQEHIDHWKRVTAHPDPPRPQRRPPPKASPPARKINLLDLAHQVSESADEQQPPAVKPKSMPTNQPKQAPKPPPKPVRPAPSPPSETPSRTPQREMPKELAKATEGIGRTSHQAKARAPHLQERA